MKLVIFASHPVQYHAPVFRGVARHLADKGHDCLVVYLSDFSIQGYRDRDFGTSFAWDEPLLDGYRSKILNQNQTEQPQSFWDLKAPGWQEILQQEKPTRVLMTTLNYQGAMSATLQARLRGIPCTLRAETTDVAIARTKVKNIARSLAYKSLYPLFDSAIAFGEFNRQHLLQHGINVQRLGTAYFSVPDRFLSIPDKQQIRQQIRQQFGFTDEQTVILFSGKLIPKKNPELILEAVKKLPTSAQSQLGIIFLGAGILEEKLKAIAADLPQLKVHFVGFKNQQEIPPYYLAADLFILPSKRQGEVWGLAVNEALQAGLPTIVTEAVGCAADFVSFPDFQVIPENDVEALANAIRNKISMTRDFDRYQLLIKNFSIEACARQMADFILSLDR